MDSDIPSVAPSAPQPSRRQLYGQTLPGETRSHMTAEALQHCTNTEELYDLKSKLGEDAGVLYIKKYKYREMYSNIGHKETCLVCAQNNTLLMVLLKSPPKDLSTPRFPSPGERKGLAYPLAMGSYPETDVISSYVCCDCCAHTLIRGIFPSMTRK